MRNLYKKRFPKRNYHQHVVDVLRMSPAQFAQFKGVARQFLGGEPLHASIKLPKKKLLPSSLKTIRDADSPATLGSLMAMEKAAHDDPTKEYHSGGGIWETGVSLFNSLWNTVGLGPEFADWFGWFDYNSPENTVQGEDKNYAKILQQSYKDIGDRSAEIGDWVRDTDLEDDRFSVWVDIDDQEAHVSLRGTKAELSDMWSDLHIIGTNTSGNDAEIYDFLKRVQEKYDNYTLDVSGHSLGSNQLIEAIESHSDLNYDRVNLFAPGTNPMWGLDNSKEAVADNKFYFYLNSGDILSNTFVSLIPSERPNVYWSKPTHNPLTNHGISQWVDTV